VTVFEGIAAAAKAGGRVRMHIEDGEVVVARVLEYDEERVLYAPVTSSRPERYAACDAVGFEMPLSAIRRATPLAPERSERSAR
jgi:hypothetical protein